MKHNLRITFILLAMFLVTQFIGLYVVNYYSTLKVINGTQVNVSAPTYPFGLEPPKVEKQTDYRDFFYGLVVSFIIAIFLLFILSKFKFAFILKAWFFIVVVLALIVSFNVFTPKFSYSIIAISLIALVLGYIKIYKRNLLVHNLTELLIYPGIAAILVPIFNLFWIIIFLILISIYDMWAVWHSGIMQKMAKYQINQLQIFSGFFVPYLTKRVREKIANLKKLPKSKRKEQKIKVNIAILGGGDVIFPTIAAGVMLKTLGLIPALCIIAGATLGLSYLFIFAEKKKFYPAMPFITVGIFLGMFIGWMLF